MEKLGYFSKFLIHSVGDNVLIKSLEWYLEHQRYGFVDTQIGRPEFWYYKQKSYLGREAKIVGYGINGYILDIDNGENVWDDNMLVSSKERRTILKQREREQKQLEFKKSEIKRERQKRRRLRQKNTIVEDKITNAIVNQTITMEDIWKSNKLAKIGEICICPSCNQSFIKKTYQQTFCGVDSAGNKTRKCNDHYWNSFKF